MGADIFLEHGIAPRALCSVRVGQHSRGSSGECGGFHILLAAVSNPVLVRAELSEKGNHPPAMADCRHFTPRDPGRHSILGHREP